MQVITSKENDYIKKIKRLKEKKYRDEEKLYIIEGIKMVQEAISEKAPIHSIVICEDAIENKTISKELIQKVSEYECIYVSEKVFKILTDVTNPQGILAVIKKQNISENIRFDEDIIVILDGVQDPGNLGTILRTIDSVGIQQVIVSKSTVDSYNPKVIRSTMGAIYRVKVIEVEELMDIIEKIKENGFEVLATSLEESESIYDIKMKKKAIIIGNEANGVSADVMDKADIKIKIPMLGKTESLNASVATGIILYEYVREKLK